MILGKHTLGETRDYLAVADYRFKETGKAYDALIANPPSAGATAGVLLNGVSLSDITTDWTALSAKWAATRKDIANELLKRALENLLVPSSLVATETQWKAIENVIQNQENVKGSLQDITFRIGQASGKPIMYENQPAQNSPDVDISLFGQLDAATKQMDAAGNAAAKATKDAVTSNTGLLVGGAVIGTIGLMAAIKHYL